MYARVTTGQVQPGKLDELIHLYEDLAPQLRGLKGFVNTQLLTDRAANKVIVVSQYETQADLEAVEALFRQSLADPRVAAALAGAPDIAVYEVAAQVVRPA